MVKRTMRASLGFVSRKFTIATADNLSNIYKKRLNIGGLPSVGILKIDSIITLPFYNSDEVGYLVPNELTHGDE